MEKLTGRRIEKRWMCEVHEFPARWANYCTILSPFSKLEVSFSCRVKESFVYGALILV